MRLIDVVQFLSMVASVFVIVIWLAWFRRWPLVIAIVIAMISNVSFYVAREFNLLSSLDLNLFSSVRVLLMVLCLVALPFSIRRFDK